MSQLMNNVEYLAKKIGPRPAGTEEEQQAALYVTEQFQKETGFSATMEDFSSASNMDAGFAALAGIEIIVTILAMIFPILSIPAFILAAAAAAIYALEAFDRPVLSRVLSRGASQNVVAKYQPCDNAATHTGRGHTRKLILVAHYDTGRVTPPLVSSIESMSLPIALICVIAAIAAAFFLLLRIFVAGGGGMALLVLNVLSIVAIAVCLLPVAKAVLLRSSPYNEGACNNATGTAALLEVARRIARGSVSEAELAVDADGGVFIHGEAAAREAGLIPEGAQIRYDAEQIAPPSEIGLHSDEDRLLSAKAAIAALTGRPVESRVFGSVAGNLVNSHVDEAFDGGIETAESVMASAETLGAAEAAGAHNAEPVAVSVTGAPAHDFSSVPGVSVPTSTSAESNHEAPADQAEGFDNAPSWFVAAQQNARKAERYNADEAPQIKRSRYNEAIENAERGFADREEELRAVEQARLEEEARAAKQALVEEEARAASAPRDALVDEADSVVETTGAAESDDCLVQGAYGQQVEPDAAPLPESPYGTVAMAAPISASEIRAEAAAADASAASDAFAAVNALPAIDLDSIAEPTAAEPETPNDPLSSAPVPAEAEPAPHSRIAALPSIDPAQPYTPEPTSSPSRSGILRKLRTNIPSLSGLIAPVEPAKPSVADAPRPAGEAPASPSSQANGSVEVPHSRSGNLINRLRKNEDEDLVGTPQQWLNVDDDFEARSVGRERGSWESFRNDQYDDYYDDQPNDVNQGANQGASGRTWQGGAFSRLQLGHVDTRSGEEGEIIEEQFVEEQTDPALSGEIEQIYHFRNPQFNTEIWFVAMGADGVSHDGARAFIEEHRDELRGSMVIEIESLGAGNLAVASEEGRVRKIAATSRVKRFTRGATAATGIPVDSVSLVGTDSIASTLQKAGCQTMHLFGAEDGRPALKGSADDVLENVSEQALEEHVSFIFELLKG